MPDADPRSASLAGAQQPRGLADVGGPAAAQRAQDTAVAKQSPDRETPKPQASGGGGIVAEEPANIFDGMAVDGTAVLLPDAFVNSPWFTGFTNEVERSIEYVLDDLSNIARDFGDDPADTLRRLGPTFGGLPLGQLPRAATKLKLALQIASPSLTRGVWDLPAARRGIDIEKALGKNLPDNFRTIDRFNSGEATSIKSIDLDSPSYQELSALASRLKGYIDKVGSFNGAGPVSPKDITSRALDLAVPNSGSAGQQAVIRAATDYAKFQGVTLRFIVFP